jgi:hypothetical protein
MVALVGGTAPYFSLSNVLLYTISQVKDGTGKVTNAFCDE